MGKHQTMHACGNSSRQSFYEITSIMMNRLPLSIRSLDAFKGRFLTNLLLDVNMETNICLPDIMILLPVNGDYMQ